MITFTNVAISLDGYYTDMNISFRLKNLDKKILEAKCRVLKYCIAVPSQIRWGFKSKCGFKVSVKEKESKKQQQSQYKDLMSLC